MWCWSGGRGILIKLSLCYSIVYNGAQWYEQFLQVDRLYRALIFLGLAPSSECLNVFGLHGAIDTKKICLHPSLYLLVNWVWWDWPLTWFTNHHFSVLWRCWLGHLTLSTKIVPEMTYKLTLLYLYLSTPKLLAAGGPPGPRCDWLPPSGWGKLEVRDGAC